MLFVSGKVCLVSMQVVVYRLIGSGAIEDKMFRLQIFKGGLSKTFMEQEQQVRFFTHKQLQPERSRKTEVCYTDTVKLCHMRLKSLFEPPNQYSGLVLAAPPCTDACQISQQVYVHTVVDGRTDRNGGFGARRLAQSLLLSLTSSGSATVLPEPDTPSASV